MIYTIKMNRLCIDTIGIIAEYLGPKEASTSLARVCRTCHLGVNNSLVFSTEYLKQCDIAQRHLKRFLLHAQPGRDAYIDLIYAKMNNHTYTNNQDMFQHIKSYIDSIIKTKDIQTGLYMYVINRQMCDFQTIAKIAFNYRSTCILNLDYTRESNIAFKRQEWRFTRHYMHMRNGSRLMITKRKRYIIHSRLNRPTIVFTDDPGLVFSCEWLWKRNIILIWYNIDMNQLPLVLLADKHMTIMNLV